MPPKSFQHAFMDALCESGGDISWMKGDLVSERFAIYQRNKRENLRNALQITYAGTWTLLGQKCADCLAYDYIRHQDQLTSSGCLDDWGGGFPHYLQPADVVKDYPYVADFANYEWLRHQCSMAAQAATLEPSQCLAALQGCEQSVAMRFVPPVRLMESQHALDWLVEILTNDQDPQDDMPQRGCYGILFKDENREVCAAWVAQRIAEGLPVDQLQGSCTAD